MTAPGTILSTTGARPIETNELQCFPRGTGELVPLTVIREIFNREVFAPHMRRLLLHLERTEEVLGRPGVHSYPRQTVPSDYPGEDRTLPPVEEEHPATGRLLLPAGPDRSDRGLRGPQQPTGGTMNRWAM